MEWEATGRMGHFVRDAPSCKWARCWSWRHAWIGNLHSTFTVIMYWAAFLQDRRVTHNAFTEYLQNACMDVKPSNGGKTYFCHISFLHLKWQCPYLSSSSMNLMPKYENLSDGLPSKLSLKKIIFYLWKPKESTQGREGFSESSTHYVLKPANVDYASRD